MFLGSRIHDELAASRRICDEHFVMWAVARAEANEAYGTWCDAPGRETYAVYLAAEDRADAAEREYVRACGRVPAGV
jgi:hypothetical protein